MGTTIDLPEPHPLQREVLEDPSPRKLIRAGRRWGKDRLALLASIAGHGPLGANGQPLHGGILSGGDVLWLGPTYPQIRSIWHEEIERRFKGHPFFELNRVERTLGAKGLGQLSFRSAETIDGVRGKRLKGCVVNEAAYLDLEYALNAVILPALLDLSGWLIVQSTPNAGPDGAEEAGGKRTPSYFNILCEKAARAL